MDCKHFHYVLAFNLYGNTRRSRGRPDPSGLLCESSAGRMRESDCVILTHTTCV